MRVLVRVRVSVRVRVKVRVRVRAWKPRHELFFNLVRESTF
jgi:hypothetical protein